MATIPKKEGLEIGAFCDALKALMAEYSRAWPNPIEARVSPVLVLYDVCTLAELNDGELMYIFGKKIYRQLSKVVNNPDPVKVKQLDLPLEMAGAAD